MAVAVLVAAPAASAETGVRFAASASAADRAAVRAAIASGRTSAQRLLREAGAAVDVEVRTHREPSAVSMMRTMRDGLQLDFSRTHLRGISRGARNQTVWHEIGHVVDLVTLSDAADAAFAEAFTRGKAHRRCFAFGGSCLDDAEIFAEQFAYWATGDRRSRSSYDIPSLIGPKAFSRLVERVRPGVALVAALTRRRGFPRTQRPATGRSVHAPWHRRRTSSSSVEAPAGR